MSFTKFQHVEKAEVASPEEHQRIESGLHKVGKRSLSDDLTAEEREQILREAFKHSK